VVQLNTESCKLYTKCISCIRDPHCGWSTASSSCERYQSQPGYELLYNQSLLHVFSHKSHYSPRIFHVLRNTGAVHQTVLCQCEDYNVDSIWITLDNRQQSTAFLDSFSYRELETECVVMKCWISLDLEPISGCFGTDFLCQEARTHLHTCSTEIKNSVIQLTKTHCWCTMLLCFAASTWSRMYSQLMLWILAVKAA